MRSIFVWVCCTRNLHILTVFFCPLLSLGEIAHLRTRMCVCWACKVFLMFRAEEYVAIAMQNPCAPGLQKGSLCVYSKGQQMHKLNFICAIASLRHGLRFGESEDGQFSLLWTSLEWDLIVCVCMCVNLSAFALFWQESSCILPLVSSWNLATWHPVYGISWWPFDKPVAAIGVQWSSTGVPRPLGQPSQSLAMPLLSKPRLQVHRWMMQHDLVLPPVLLSLTLSISFIQCIYLSGPYPPLLPLPPLSSLTSGDRQTGNEEWRWSLLRLGVPGVCLECVA